ncbi:MAG: hypothetical protein L3J42_04280 [Hydrogenimonas sp.]|nr:hypothetical protein [Hydrogenimonas sp.]
MRKLFQLRISEIEKDRVNGASYLTKKCAEAFKMYTLSGASKESLVEAALLIAKSRPMMASIFRLANEILFAIDRGVSQQKLAKVCDRYILRMERSSKETSSIGVTLISKAKTVLTHSFSSLVKDALIEVKSRGAELKVYCTESRPAQEGRRLAQELDDHGISTTLIADAAAPYIVKECDLVVVGADGVGTFGLIHKIGTYAIALAAQKGGVDFIVLAPELKFWPKDMREPKEPIKSEDELRGEGSFDVLNIYFDVTPLEYLSAAVNENGVSKQADIINIFKKIELHPLLRSIDG